MIAGGSAEAYDHGGATLPRLNVEGKLSGAVRLYVVEGGGAGEGGGSAQGGGVRSWADITCTSRPFAIEGAFRRLAFHDRSSLRGGLNEHAEP